MSQVAFVTGGTGFVGAHLLGILLREGWRVTLLVRPTSSLAGLDGQGADLREGDVTDPDSLRAAIPRPVDAVFHVAASTSIWSRNNPLQTRVNVDGTRNVVQAAIAAGARRLVHTSSFLAWGFWPGVLDETREPSAADDWINYIRTKRRAENIVKEAVAEGRLDAVICNPAHILGPGDRHNWSRMIRMVDRGTLPGVPPGGGAFADVREVARAHLSAFHRGLRGRNYLLGGEDATFLEVIRIVGELLGKPVPDKASPAWLLRLAGRLEAWRAALSGREPDLTPEGAAMVTRYLACDSGRARRDLAYRTTPVHALLEDTCDWMRVEGMLA